MDGIIAMLFAAIFPGILVVLIIKIFFKDERKKVGIYQPQGLHLLAKKYLALCYLKWFHPKPKLLMNQNLASMAPCDTGILPTSAEETVDNVRKLPDEPHMVDGIGFMGADAKGNLLVVRLDRRKDGRAEVWLYLRTFTGEQYQLPCHPDTRGWQVDRKSNTFSAGGLRIEPIMAMRRWRVTFNGLLRKGIRTEYDDKKHAVVHVRFNFLWMPSLQPHDFNHNINCEMFSNAIAAESWGLDFFQSFKLTDAHCFDQWGQLMGTIKIGHEEEEELLLRGPRRRTFGHLEWALIEQYTNFYITTEDGNAIHASAENRTKGLRRKFNGYVIRSKNSLHQIDYCDFTWQKLRDLLDGSKRMTMTFQAGGLEYTIEISRDVSECAIYAGEKWDMDVQLIPIKIQIGDKCGQGVLEMGMARKHGDLKAKIREPAPQFLEIEPDAEQNEASVYVVSFKDFGCRRSQVVGGKALSLAYLNKMITKDFIVPSGICITVSAFWRQISRKPELRDAIQNLQNVAWKVKDGDLKIECERVVDIISKTIVDEEIMQQLKDKMNQVFKNQYSDLRFAVRSSAIGEDSEDTSAAGQNATYLGVQGFEELKRALAKCWASQFSYQSVEYKRHHGQLINSGMGVVIQEMVPAEIAGVMFTRDPVTGNPEFITITANYGLGESVVSATTDPDTIKIKRNWDNEVTIGDKIIGNKDIKVVMKEDCGVEEKLLDSMEKSQCCVSDSQIRKLAKIALDVEFAFGTPRDIEWAISGNEVYLLQSRPVTSLASETEYEVKHWSDSATLTDSDCYSRANMGEIFPGCLTPLTLSTFLATMEMVWQRYCTIANPGYVVQPYNFRTLYVSHGQAHISLTEGLQGVFSDEKTPSAFAKGFEMAILGRPVTDEKFQKHSYERFGKPTLLHIFKKIQILFRDLFISGKSAAEHARITYDNWTLKTQNCTNSLQLYNLITQSLAHLHRVHTDHVSTSFSSISWNLIILSVLTKNSTDWTLDHLSDLSVLLGNCSDVISADIPASIKAIAEVIKRDQQAAEFAQMSPQQAKKWLQTHQGESRDAYQRFLKMHSHRCVKEQEFRSVPWGDNPEGIIANIQKLVSVTSTTTDTKRVYSPAETITKIQSPMNKIARVAMTWMLPRSRDAISRREFTKSILLKVFNQFRQAFHLLATMLVHEGRIPDEDLIFFFSYHELGQLTLTRSARLVSRATRRRNLYPTLNALQFPEISIGVAKPLQANLNCNIESNFQMKAISVSPGCVQGTARVLLDVNEANQIEPGDILITYATDIGWSPYFPMLGGIVTEIGGIISHGAVVAREYGLPCLISAAGAATLFKSGETVLLDANKGTLTKIIN